MKYSIYHNIRISSGDPVISPIFSGDVSLSSFVSLIINNDIDSLTDTASIIIPKDKKISLTSKELTVKTETGFDLKIKRGNEITIYLDFYRDENDLEEVKRVNQNNFIFFGYVKGFETDDSTITILCEDSMWLLKQKKINFSFPTNTKSKDFFNYIIDQYDLKSLIKADKLKLLISDADLGKLRSTSYITATEFLQKLKDDYGYYSYFNLSGLNAPIISRYREFIFGLKYNLKLGDVTPLKFSYPYDRTKHAIVQNDLNYELFDKQNELIIVGKTIDNIKNKEIEIATVDGINILTKKKDIETQVNNKDFRVDIKLPTTNQTTLENLIKDAWNNYPESKFTGSFTKMGTPHVKVGDIIELNIDDGFGTFIKEVYYVDKVVTEVNSNSGFLQTVTLGSKIKIN